MNTRQDSTPPQLHIADGVARVTLNRPLQRNRLENADLDTLLQHFQRIESDPSVRVVVLTAHTHGQPKPVFCAGYDIGGFQENAQGSTAFERVPEALAALRPITVCALNGSVYGGATDLVLACDLRIGLRGIEWRMPATALGLHYYPSGLRRYVQQWGVVAAKRAFLSARPFNDVQLQALGVCDEWCTPDEWSDRVSLLVNDVLALAPSAVQATKRSLNDIASGTDLTEQLRQRETDSAASEDFAEGLAAFAQRRRPQFTDR